METDFLSKLTAITAEETEILSGGDIKQSRYTSSPSFVIPIANLSGDKPIDMRVHTRFTPFPLHGHDYLEIMYVYNGSITHRIDGRPTVVNKGDILFLNRHVRHSLDSAGQNDIGINFIVSDGFLQTVLNNMQPQNVLYTLISEHFKANGNPDYLLFRIGNAYPIRNLLDNLIYTLAGDRKEEFAILPQATALLFGYLSLYSDTLAHDYVANKDELLKQQVNAYLAENYPAATLKALASKLSLSEEYLSRRITRMFGSSFRELLLNQRLSVAESLLLTTDIDVSDVITTVGYENKSYFHRIFLAKHKTTPLKWRKAQKR